MAQHTAKQGREIILFHAGESLLEQVTQWCGQYRDVSLRLIASRQESMVRNYLARSMAAVIDATERPEEAMRTLAQALGRCDCTPGQLGVYTETMHVGLEMFVRLRGALLLLGPMDQAEWDGFFALDTIRLSGINATRSGQWASQNRTEKFRLLSGGDQSDESHVDH